MNIVVVLPTYNERESVGETLGRLLALEQRLAPHALTALVVDGNSPDGTAAYVQGLGRKNVRVMVESGKSGLGAAYALGMREAMEKLRADIVVEMDADLQHDPGDLPRLIAAIAGGADVAVGTRFMEGGSVPSEWALPRRLISRAGNLYARALLGMWRYRDITSGFRATRAGYLSRLPLEQLLSKRFAYKIELYYRLAVLGASIAEVPIAFSERRKGGSKQEFLSAISRNDVLDSLRVVGVLFARRMKTFFYVGSVGAFGALLQTIILSLLVEKAGLSPVLGNTLAAEAAVISNFTLNNALTFRDRAARHSFPVRFLLFNAASLGSIALQAVIIALGSALLGREGYLLYAIFGIGAGWILNYLLYTRVVWRPK